MLDERDFHEPLNEDTSDRQLATALLVIIGMALFLIVALIAVAVTA